MGAFGGKRTFQNKHQPKTVLSPKSKQALDKQHQLEKERLEKFLTGRKALLTDGARRNDFFSNIKCKESDHLSKLETKPLNQKKVVAPEDDDQIEFTDEAKGVKSLADLIKAKKKQPFGERFQGNEIEREGVKKRHV